MKLKDLIPDDRNANKHSPEGMERLKKGLKENGAGRSILISSDNKIIAGNGVTEGAGVVGIEDVQIIDSDGTKVIAVRRTDIKSGTREFYNMALSDNIIAKENIVMDAEVVDAICEEYEIEEWKNPEVIAEAVEDDFDGVAPKEPITVLGDLYEIGGHRLLCGDSRDSDLLTKLLNGVRPDLLLIDPPYGIGIDGQKKSISKNPKHNRKAHEFMGWDEERPDKSTFDLLMIECDKTIIWGGNYFADLLPASRGWIYWSKGQDGLTMSDGELAWTSEDKPLRSLVVNRAALQNSVHPTQKPTQVIEFCINYVKEVNTICDTYCGSGTTMVVSNQLNKICYAMELEPKYCDVIIARMIKLDPTLPIKRNGVLLTKEEVSAYTENTK